MTDLDDNAIADTPTTTGTEDWWAYLERLADRNRQRAESAAVIEEMILADRARLKY